MWQRPPGAASGHLRAPCSFFAEGGGDPMGAVVPFFPGGPAYEASGGESLSVAAAVRGFTTRGGLLGLPSPLLPRGGPPVFFHFVTVGFGAWRRICWCRGTSPL